MHPIKQICDRLKLEKGIREKKKASSSILLFLHSFADPFHTILGRKKMNVHTNFREGSVDEKEKTL